MYNVCADEQMIINCVHIHPKIWPLKLQSIFCTVENFYYTSCSVRPSILSFFLWSKLVLVSSWLNFRARGDPLLLTNVETAWYEFSVFEMRVEFFLQSSFFIWKSFFLHIPITFRPMTNLLRMLPNIYRITYRNSEMCLWESGSDSDLVNTPGSQISNPI